MHKYVAVVYGLELGEASAYHVRSSNPNEDDHIAFRWVLDEKNCWEVWKYDKQPTALSWLIFPHGKINPTCRARCHGVPQTHAVISVEDCEAFNNSVHLLKKISAGELSNCNIGNWTLAYESKENAVQFTHKSKFKRLLSKDGCDALCKQLRFMCQFAQAEKPSAETCV